MRGDGARGTGARPSESGASESGAAGRGCRAAGAVRAPARPAGVRAGLAACAVLAVAGCHRRAAVAPAPAPAHYTTGVPWQGGQGVWFYPAESFSGVATGLASVEGAHGPFTADGERYDPQVAAGASQTLQLPAVARVTNLENGREMLLRIDDRGPGDPGRVLGLTPRAAALLGIGAGGGATRVRVAVEEGLSRRLAEQLHGGPRLDIATAPREAVRAEALGAPGGAAGGVATIGAAPAEDAAEAVPDRLAETVREGDAAPGELWLRTDSFGQASYARRLAARLSGLPVAVVRTREGRGESYAVRAGPFAGVAEADAALAQALRAGVADARIVVQ